MGLATLEGKYNGGGTRACLGGLETDPRRYHPIVLTAWVNHFKGYATIEDVRAATAHTGVADGLRPTLTFGRVR